MYPSLSIEALTAFAENRYADLTPDDWESFFHPDNHQYLGQSLVTKVLCNMPLSILEGYQKIRLIEVNYTEDVPVFTRYKTFTSTLNTLDELYLQHSWTLFEPERFCLLIQMGLYKKPDINGALVYLSQYKNQLTPDQIRIIFSEIREFRHLNLSRANRISFMECHAYVTQGLWSNRADYYQMLIESLTPIALAGTPFTFYAAALHANGFLKEPDFINAVWNSYAAESSGRNLDLLTLALPHVHFDPILQWYNNAVAALALLEKPELSPDELLAFYKGCDPTYYASRMASFSTAEGAGKYLANDRKSADKLSNYASQLLNHLERLAEVPFLRKLMQADSRWVPLLTHLASLDVSGHSFVKLLALPNQNQVIDQLYTLYPSKDDTSTCRHIAMDFMENGYLHETPNAAEYLAAFVELDFLVSYPSPELLKHPYTTWLSAASALIHGTQTGAYPASFYVYDDSSKKRAVQILSTCLDKKGEPLTLFETLQALMVLHRFDTSTLKNWIRLTSDPKIPQTYVIAGITVKVSADRAPYYRILGPSLAHSWFTTSDGLASLISNRTGRHEMMCLTFIQQNFPEYVKTAAPVELESGMTL